MSSWDGGLKSNETDFRRQFNLGELPQFSAGVSLAAAAAEGGQGQGI